ncbi:MAG: S8 family serine peptidase [Chloroflexi bacterium]|nr:S8 family serine peptidase [Chloroflexota bacterium]
MQTIGGRRWWRLLAVVMLFVGLVPAGDGAGSTVEAHEATRIEGAAAPAANHRDAASLADASAAAWAADAPPDLVPTPSIAPGPGTVKIRRGGQSLPITLLDKTTGPNGRAVGAGRILVAFRGSAGAAAIGNVHRAAGTAAVEATRLPGVVVARTRPDQLGRALATYRARPEVAWAEPDYVRRATLVPNDPRFDEQWALQKIQASAAWNATRSASSVRIAILDCGIYSSSSLFTMPNGERGHPDVRSKVVLEHDFTGSPYGADDFCDHGTLMAGVAAASTNNGIGIAGVGFDASLMNGKVLGDDGFGLDSWIASGIVWAADNGAQVISLSLGEDSPCGFTLQSAVDYAWNRGAVIVAAAGNGDANGIGLAHAEAPGNCNHVLAIAATDPSDSRAVFSNYGDGVDLAAPGVSILSTDFIGGYHTVTGTSPATPHVAGVAALVWTTPAGTSNQSVVDQITQTADRIAGTGTLWQFGRLNAAGAVAPIVDCSPRPPVTVRVTPTGGALSVTLTATGSGNAIRSIGTGGRTPTNAIVDLPPPVGSTSGSFTYQLATGSASVTFQVRRATTGQATTVPLVVTDACGDWPTFVGGGPSAF